MRRTLVLTIAILVATAAFAPFAAASGATSAGDSTLVGDATSETGPVFDASAGGCEYPIELEDRDGETVTIEDRPESIVALYPSDAQKAFTIGADDRLTGMPIGQYTEGLEVDGQTDISEDDGLTPDLETVIALEPDVVLAASIAEEDVVEGLREAGIDVYVFETETTLEDVVHHVELTGQLAGSCEGAAVATDWMDERLGIVEDAVAEEDHPLTLYAMDDQGFTAGTGTFQHDVLTTAGVTNLGAEAGIEGWAIVDDEDVIDADPEWIVYGEFWGEPPVSEAVGETTAMQESQHVGIDSSDVSQPAPKVVYAVEEIFAAIHPDAHAEVEADLDAADERYESELAALADDDEADGDDAADEDDEDAADETDDEDGADEDPIPGFGLPVAVAGLLAALAILLARR